MLHTWDHFLWYAGYDEWQKFMKSICGHLLQVPDAFQGLIDKCYDIMKTTIENEESVPIEYVTNMDEVRTLMNLFHIYSKNFLQNVFYNAISI